MLGCVTTPMQSKLLHSRHLHNGCSKPLSVHNKHSSRRAGLICLASYSKKTEKKAELPVAAPVKQPTPPVNPPDTGLPEIEEQPATTPAAEQPSTSAAATDTQDATNTQDGKPKRTPQEEEIAALARKYREARASEQGQQQGFVQGLTEEIGLIEWPSPTSALLNTLLVITIVLVASATLFAMNGVLSEVAQLYYGPGGVQETIRSFF